MEVRTELLLNNSINFVFPRFLLIFCNVISINGKCLPFSVASATSDSDNIPSQITWAANAREREL